jgi:O-antigen ligase
MPAMPTASRALAASARVSATAIFTGLVGVAAAYSVATGMWTLVVAGILFWPAFLALRRDPLVALPVWVVVAPLVVVTESGALRKLFWLVHRGLPPAALVLVVAGAVGAGGLRRLPRPGPAELLMAGYVVVTAVSIGYTSATVLPTTYDLYDRVVAPMCLYAVVRFGAHDERRLRNAAVAVGFLLSTQSLVAAASFVAPGALPSAWLGKLGERTVGSLQSPDVFGTTMLFCAVVMLHVAARTAGRLRALAALGFVLGLSMAFLTFSRASWLAALVVVFGSGMVYRRALKPVAVALVPVVVVLAASGVLTAQLDHARERLSSPESRYSALSRLPVMYAAINMFEARPVAGWGYGDFDRYDRQFQQRVGDLVYPDDKDLSSHNLYLTTIAEQGVVGFVLLYGPAVYWLGVTVRRRRILSRDGPFDPRLVWGMWFVVGSHVVVNNFSRMQIPVGFGVWWLALGVVGAAVGARREPAGRDTDARSLAAGAPS